MAQIDIDEVKRVSAELSTHTLPRVGIPQTSEALAKNRRKLQKFLKSYFNKTGLAVNKVNKLMTDRQAEKRKIFAEQVANSHNNLNNAQIGFRQGMNNRYEALQLLSAPFESTFIILDKPFLILETPTVDLETFISSHIEALNSSAKIRTVKQGGDGFTFFRFYFLWTNSSQSAVVVNVKTSLVLNGICGVLADTGILFGHDNVLILTAGLQLTRWTGWGTDNQTRFPFEQSTQFQTPAYLQARGGGLFGDSDLKEQEFNFQPFDLSCDQIAIPAGATTLFEVWLSVQYGFGSWAGGSGGDGDLITMDFASDEFDFRIICPLVALELLAPRAVLTTT
jgi:hypothetical protein